MEPLLAPQPHPVLSEKPRKTEIAAAIDPKLETRQRQEEGLETIAFISWEPIYYTLVIGLGTLQIFPILTTT